MTDTAPTDPRLAEAAACLRSGGVLLVPTDTVFGLAVMPSLPQAIDRLFRLKDRPRAKNLPVMVAGADQLRAIGVDVTAPVARLIDSPFVPGALTIAAGLAPVRADWLADRSEIAFRLPDDAFLLALIARAGPLLVTSANRSGQPTPTDVAGVLAQLTDRPDMVIDGTVKGDTPSTLINCRATPPRIERVGAIPPQNILDWLG